jgi:hypothetical protein
MTTDEEKTEIPEDDLVENGRMLRKVKLMQLGLEGFQLGLLFVFFNGIQENYLSGGRRLGVFKFQGFRQFYKVPFICSFAFCTIDYVSNLLSN